MTDVQVSTSGNTAPDRSGILPTRDQKAYDLGAQSAREVIDELRREVDVLQGERDAQIARADGLEAELAVVRITRRAAAQGVVGLSAEGKHWKAAHADVAVRKRGAEMIIENLRKALRTYGGHLPTCAGMGWFATRLASGNP